MVHTVGFLGVNGQVGKDALPPLVQAHHDGKIKLVILTRSGSAVKNLNDSEVEIRQVDIDDSASLDKGLQGIHTLLTTISMNTADAQKKIVDAVKRSPDAIILIPSHFGAPWRKEDYDAYPGLEGLEAHLDEAVTYAHEAGISVTQVETGGFHTSLYHSNSINVDLKANKIEANEAQLRHPFPIINTEDLAAALTDLVIRDPSSIKNKRFSVVSHWATGNDLIDIFTKIHGTRPEVVNYDEAAKKAALESKPIGPLVAALKGRWEGPKEGWGFAEEIKVTPVRSLEQTARDSLREMQA